METRQVSIYEDKETGDINELRDNKLAKLGISDPNANVGATDYVELMTSTGEPIKVTQQSLAAALGSIFAASDPKTFTKLLGMNSGSPMGIGPSDLASVLGVSPFIKSVYMSWSSICYKITFTNNSELNFYYESHGYSAQNYVDVSFYIAFGTTLYNPRVRANNKTLDISEQGNMILYKKTTSEFYIYYTFNCNGVATFRNTDQVQSPLKIEKVYPIPDFSGMTKLFELKDYNGQTE